VTEPTLHPAGQRQFFDYAGPLFSVVISPASSTTPINERRTFRALPGIGPAGAWKMSCSLFGKWQKAVGRLQAR
jgi:hypothetical protein